MKTIKNNNGILSLADVQRRKIEIQRDISLYEEVIQKKVYRFTHPFSFFSEEENDHVSSLEYAGNIGNKLRSIVSIASTAFSIYSLFRKRRR
jgi:hypothetical protein